MISFIELKAGADNAPVFVLLHGFGGFAEVWADVAKGLDGRVLAVDLPGHGASINHDSTGRAGAMAGAIADAVRVADLGAVHLCGHSMGGAVASLFAAQNTDLVKSLLLLAPGGFGAEIAGPMLRNFAKAADAMALRAALQPMCAASFSIPQPVIETGVQFRAQTNQLEKLIEIGDLITKGDTQGVIPAAILANIACPVRVLWGQEDELLPAKQIFHAPPHFEPLLLDGLGHMLIEEAPEIVSAHVNSLAASTLDL